MCSARKDTSKMVRSSSGKLRHFMAASLGVMAATIGLLLLLEVVLRPVAYFTHGQSLYYLLYGVPGLAGRVGISPWHVFDGSYFKFPPNYVLQGAAGQGEETATTNSQGFRGPDIQVQKPGNVFRIICLGGSSTFGYHNRDDETYPFLLQEILRAHAHGPGIEVMNAGFPYYNTSSILALLKAELLDYSPDVITIYAAYNDSSWPVEISPLFRLLTWVQEHSAIYLMLKESLLTDQRVYKGLFAVQRFERLYPNVFNLEHRTKEIQADIDANASRYRRNITEIIRIAKSHGIKVVLIKQPMTISHWNRRLAGDSYEQEYAVVRRKFESGQALSTWERSLLAHHRLIKELGDIAARENLPVVDNIAIVDRDHSRLASWVHLTKEGNQALAEALAQAIEPFIAAAEPTN